MKGNFRTLFRRFCLDGSLTVMKYFYVYPDPISRSFWAVLVAAMFMMAWFLTYLLYMRFADMPTRITIENQYESIKDLPYPTITICSPNRITIAAVHHLNKTLVDGNVTADLDRIIPIVLGFYDPALQSSDDTAHQLQSLIDLNRYTTTEVMAMLPQQCDEFLQMCQLGHTRYPHCRGLFDPVLTTYGLCCSFNSKYHYVKSNKRNEVKANFTSRLAFSSSLNNAFTVVVDYNPAGAIDRTILAAGGIRVLFTDHTEFPADDVSNLVLANTESLHIIHATHTYCSEDVKVLPVTSRKCYLQDERHLPYFHDYHNSDCDHVCFADSIKSYCGCELFYLPYVRLTHVCNATKIKCIGETKREEIYHHFSDRTSSNDSQMGRDGNVTADLDRIIPIVLGFYDPALQSSDDTAHQLQSLIDLNRYTTTEVLAMLPQQCDEFLQMCQLGHTRYPHCRGLFDPVLTTYGLCCSFNSKYHYVKTNKRNEVKANFTSRLAFSSSLNNAFTVVVDYNPAGAIDRTILAAGGIRVSKVLFTDHTEFPADDVSNLVLTNTESLHIIHATHTYCSEDVKVLPVTSRKCYLKDERHLPYFHDYHNSDCDHVCFADSIKSYCGCELFYLPYVRLTHVCNATKIKCIGETKLSRHPPQKASTCKCLRDCESRRYTVELSTGNLDALPYMFNDMYRGIKFNKSTAIMHFFFPNSVYVKQKQETVISIVTLASNLGGVFGLCVGVSFISALELPFYVYMAIKNHIKYQMRKRSGRIVHLK
ncbi:sodium channel protein Nach-like [Ostrinia furnacalis]|uniref:sodium channel protein Nach-like n=1 Tax=Ostrinia furnacalis TaxID=93504 RepID=UPI00103DE651|nr:sodium channel protein Nach-like [Ostrinia furnacalis]